MSNEKNFRFVYTFWSSVGEDAESRFHGEEKEEYQKQLCKLSIYMLRETYPDAEIVMYTDNKGKEFFETLPELNEVYDTLEELNTTTDPCFYAAGKMKALETENFIEHPDKEIILLDYDILISGDVFSKFKYDYFDLLVQSIEECQLPRFFNVMRYHKPELIELYPKINFSFDEQMLMFNCGVLWFKNDSLRQEFMSEYYRLRQTIVDFLNEHAISKHGIDVEILIEQRNIYSICEKEDMNCVCLLGKIDDSSDSDSNTLEVAHELKLYTTFDDDVTQHFDDEYLHLYGNFKFMDVVKKFVADKLKEFEPEEVVLDENSDSDSDFITEEELENLNAEIDILESKDEE